MIGACANPRCRKPLHYLREGRIFIFETGSAKTTDNPRRLEHYWLCGACSKQFVLMRDEHGVHVAHRPPVRPFAHSSVSEPRTAR